MRGGVNLIILLVAVVVGGLAVLMVRQWVATHEIAHVAIAEPSETIVVATAPLAYGAQITADDVAEISWPAKSLPEGAFSTVQDLLKDGRRVALSPFVRNEPIISSKVSAPNQRASLSTVIEPGKRAVTVAVDDVRGVAGFVFPGDFVDVVLTRTNSNDGPQNYSEVILQHVKVLAIDQIAGDRQDRPTVARAVTVELTSEQALKVTLAANIGRLSLILRQSTEEATAPDQRITDHDIFAGDVGPKEEPAPAVAAPDPQPSRDPSMRKVTVIRAMKGDDYEVPREAR